MASYTDPLSELLASFSTDETSGLSAREAEKRLEHYGPNNLRTKKKLSLAARFALQFKDTMIVILLIAAGVSLTVSLLENEGIFEPLLIVAIVVVNAIIGVTQESKAEKALEALKNLSAPKAKVIRDGKQLIVDSSQLVPGDIITVEAGDFVPADARLITSASLSSDESALTGESVPAQKDEDTEVLEDAPVGDRFNMVYAGCSINNGHATALVVATGMNTEMGKIADLLDNESDTQTPLQQRLSQLGKYLGLIAIVACVIVFIIGLLEGMNMLEIFMIAVSLAVSAIPEGLPAIVTIVLAIGVQRMVKKNAIIRRLPAVETLGSASVICSDKTGTLTQNRMTLTRIYSDASQQTEDVSAKNSETAKQILAFATLCSDGSITVKEDGSVSHVGDPTETAIVLAAHNNGMTKESLTRLSPRLAEIPFDSDRKLMTTVHKIDGKLISITKGSFDSIAEKSTSGDIDRAKHIVEELSNDALRVLAVAYKEIPAINDDPTPDELENDLTFLGLVGMIDPPREEAKQAVALCRQAGIKPIMITGDHIATASAIAKQLDILQPDDRSITGKELNAMDDEALAGVVRSIAVYARVSPADKIRIVKAWQKQGQVVAMTGDGVNDAPALKAADIGCAMGVTGTDVAKGAADMTLTDDNFATIVVAVKEGRGIYDNIRKVVAFLLGTNIGEVLTVLVAMLLWHESPFLAVQLLWINLVTDSLPAIALGMEPVEDSVMKKQPKPKQEGIFAHKLWLRIGLLGVMFATLSLVSFAIGREATGSLAGGQTMAFITLAVSQVVHAFNARSDRSIFSVGLFSNKYLLGATALSLYMMLVVVFVPAAASAFGLLQLSTNLYLIAFGLAFLPLPIVETVKLFARLRHS